MTTLTDVQSRVPRSRARFAISDAAAPSVFLYPGLLVLLAIGLYPFLFCVYVSFQNYYLAAPGRSHFVGFDNYIAAFEDTDFWNSVAISARFILTAVAAEVILGFAIALLLNSALRFNAIWRTAILIPMLMTPIVVGSVWKFMLNPQFGVLAYLFGLVGFHSEYLGGPSSALWFLLLGEVWQWTPFVTLICLAGLATLPAEPFEAAAVDGASPLQTFRHLTVPLMRPFLLIALVLRFITAYKVFDTIYIMTGGGPGVSSQVLALRVYETAFVNLQIGDASALSVLTLIVAILITRLFIFRILRAQGEAR